MSPTPTTDLDLRRLAAPETVTFAEPWQAYAYALAYTLHRADVFTWEEWTRTLGARLKAHPDGDGSEYYVAWLEAVEELVVGKDVVAADKLDALKEAWREAYRTTPHGKPVVLPPRSADQTNEPTPC